MTSLKSLLEQRHKIKNQNEQIQKELYEFFNQENVINIIKESLFEKLEIKEQIKYNRYNNIYLNLKLKQPINQNKHDYYILECYQNKDHLYPSFTVTIQLKKTESKLNIYFKRNLDYELNITNDQIKNSIKELIGV